MARSVVLALVLLVLIIVSQFEWKQKLVGDIVSTHRNSGKEELKMKKEEIIQEKIILLQEKRIQQLDKLVSSLQQQLLQCQGGGEGSKGGEANYTSSDNLNPGNPSDIDNYEVESQPVLPND